jgi:hypothetical protein
MTGFDVPVRWGRRGVADKDGQFRLIGRFDGKDERVQFTRDLVPGSAHGGDVPL